MDLVKINKIGNIPKIFMQTWKDKNVPKQWSISPKSIEKYMPDWKYVLMTDEDNLNFVKKYFPSFLKTFINFPYPIQRADAIRYMWLYVNGGIYMDLDFYLKGNLEDLLISAKYKNSNLYFVKYGEMYTNSFIVSSPKNPFWLKVIKEMKKSPPWYVKLMRSIEVYHTTGPSMLTTCINYYSDNFKIFSQKDICTWNAEIYENSKYSYIGVLEGKSWHGPLEKCGTFLTTYWFIILLILLSILFIYFLIKRK